jgi:hypothetical protein
VPVPPGNSGGAPVDDHVNVSWHWVGQAERFDGAGGERDVVGN